MVHPADADRFSILMTLRPRLRDWYAANARALPWRGPAASAYAVWVSEVMLQQTQVAAVVPYFDRWMNRFPSLEHLAAAPLEEVLRYWAGLGYYARARNLHRAAKEVAENLGGSLPSDMGALQRLPGVGRYTAGAIASLAYGEPVGIVDANVERVLCRLFGLEEDPKGAGTARRLAAIADALVPPEAPGAHNQALMELGALVCTPTDPACEKCPLLRACHAGQTASPTDWPKRRTGKRQVRVAHASAALFRTDGRLLMARRNPHGLWGGLWELPRRVCAVSETPAQAAARALQEVAGLQALVEREIAAVRHSVMHYAITLHVLYAANAEGQEMPLDCAELRWLRPHEARELPLAAPQQRALEYVVARQDEWNLVAD